MKFFVAFAALVAVALASPLKPTSSDYDQLEAIIAAINSPSTDPATAALLEQQLQDIYGFHPIHVGPAIVDTGPQPIQVGPAVVGPVNPPKPEPVMILPAEIPFPVFDEVQQPIMTLPAEIPFPVFDEASPVAVVSGPSSSFSSSPLVQIIVNVNQASDVAVPVASYPIEGVNPTPVHIVDAAQEEINPSPVHIVDEAQEEIIPSPVHIVDEAQEEIIPSPVHIVDEAQEEIIPSPVNIVEEADAPAEPIIIGNPIVPIPVITIPETLN